MIDYMCKNDTKVDENPAYHTALSTDGWFAAISTPAMLPGLTMFSLNVRNGNEVANWKNPFARILYGDYHIGTGLVICIFDQSSLQYKPKTVRYYI